LVSVTVGGGDDLTGYDVDMGKPSLVVLPSLHGTEMLGNRSPISDPRIDTSTDLLDDVFQYSS
jgi:hypothetical protein